MSEKGKNFVFIMADEHNSKVLGCYGHPIVKTPNLDLLAKKGTLFQNGYTNSPVCIPSRASFATGKYVHETGNWDNASPYDGKVKGWGHRLQESGNSVTSIGKLHYRNTTDPTGFDEQISPMHALDGQGDVFGSIREPDLPVRKQSRDLALEIGPGETQYTKYDREIRDKSCDWIQNIAKKKSENPWFLFVSFISPHYPLIVPEEFYEMYPLDEIELPKQRKEEMNHPWWDAFEKCWTFNEHFEDDEKRKIAIASYYGLCSFVDDNVGKILASIDDSGISEETRIMYIGDHGDNLGARNLWGKATMYEESVSVPMIISGEGFPKDSVIETPVSLIDCYPTIIESMGIELNEEDKKRPGKSLFSVVKDSVDMSRIVFSEYHAAGSITASYMIRHNKYKYIYYVGYRPELYDLENDPEELNDISEKPESQKILIEYENILRKILDPEKTDKSAKKDQRALVESYGGREHLLKRGGINTTPAPGKKAKFT